MAQLVLNHTLSLIELEQEVIYNANNILPSIDLDKLLRDPKAYALTLGLTFLNEHMDEIEQGITMGEQFANEVLKKSG